MPSSGMADSFKLWWAWRGTVHRALSRSLLPFSLALAYTIASLAASISSSYVVSRTGLDVLVNSPHCARLNNSVKTRSLARKYVTKVSATAEGYARECYRNETTLSSRCNIFARTNVRLSKDYVSCPFSGMCRGSHHSAIAVDSGLVDVVDAFGLNLRPEESVKFRKETTCAVLPLEGRTTVVEASQYFAQSYVQSRPGLLVLEQIMLFHYGTNLIQGGWQNATQAFSLASSNFTNNYVVQGWVSYVANERIEQTIFQPLPEMQRDDADIALVGIVKGSVKYQDPVHDAVFSAHKTHVQMDYATGPVGFDEIFFISDDSVSFVGCALQYQYCVNSNAGDRSCSELTGLPGNISRTVPHAAGIQLAILELLVALNYIFDLTILTTLNASENVRAGFYEGSLLDDQWATEVVDWESISWASLHISLSDYATGPRVRDPAVDAYTIQPATSREKALCMAQKMRKSGGFLNIDLFGLIFITTMAGVIIVVDISLLEFLIFLSRFRRALAPRIDRWIQDGVLQLQRRAYEAQGYTAWTDRDKDVPRTTANESLPDLSSSDVAATRKPEAQATISSGSVAQVEAGDDMQAGRL